MASLRKYLFDVDFGPPRPTMAEAMGIGIDPANDAPVEIEPPPPPPPTFTEQEMMATRDEAFEEGRRAGVTETSNMMDSLLSKAMDAIARQLGDLAAQQAADNEERIKESVAVAVAVVRKLLPEMIRLFGIGEIEGVIHDCLTQIDRDMRVTVRVNPVQMDGIKEKGSHAARSTGFEGKLLYHADPRLAMGDCRVEWGHGGAERDTMRILQEIEALVERAAGAFPSWLNAPLAAAPAAETVGDEPPTGAPTTGDKE